MPPGLLSKHTGWHLPGDLVRDTNLLKLQANILSSWGTDAVGRQMKYSCEVKATWS